MATNLDFVRFELASVVSCFSFLVSSFLLLTMSG